MLNLRLPLLLVPETSWVSFFFNNELLHFKGTRIGVNEAEKHIFGMVLMNDWSARDIQRDILSFQLSFNHYTYRIRVCTAWTFSWQGSAIVIMTLKWLFRTLEQVLVDGLSQWKHSHNSKYLKQFRWIRLRAKDSYYNNLTQHKDPIPQKYLISKNTDDAYDVGLSMTLTGNEILKRWWSCVFLLDRRQLKHTFVSIKLEIHVLVIQTDACTSLVIDDDTILIFTFRIGGCQMMTGDLLGSGTISGKSKESYGSMVIFYSITHTLSLCHSVTLTLCHSHTLFIHLPLLYPLILSTS